MIIFDVGPTASPHKESSPAPSPAKQSSAEEDKDEQASAVVATKGTKVAKKGKVQAAGKAKAAATVGAAKKKAGRPSRNAPHLLRCMFRELKEATGDNVKFFGDRYSAVHRNMWSYMTDINSMLEEEKDPSAISELQDQSLWFCCVFAVLMLQVRERRCVVWM